MTSRSGSTPDTNAPDTDKSTNAQPAEKPGKKEPVEKPDDGSAIPDPVKPAHVARWATASQDVRATARWIVTSAAAAAAVVFGGGPLLIKGELSGDAWLRGIGAVLAATAGVCGIVLIIGRTARVLLPYEVRIDDLPKHLKKEVRRSRGVGWFPDDIQTPEKFLRRLRLWERESRVLPGQILRLRAQEEASKAKVEELEEQLATAREAAKTKLTAELDERRQETEKLAARVAELEQALHIAAGNVKVYLETRDMILERAEYDEVVRRQERNQPWLAFGTILAVAGAATYLLLLGYKPKEAPEVTETPVLATLTRLESKESTDLWNTVGLAPCETRPTKVAVVKESGKGTDEDPYVVRTLPGMTNCPVVSFAVAGLAGQLTFPSDETVKIEYVTTTTTKPNTSKRTPVS